MINPEDISKMITDDPDILNEGWEELGIEDPNFQEPSGLKSAEIIRKVQSYFNTNFPDVEFNFMPAKNVDVQTFLMGQFPFTIFISDSALDEMTEGRAGTFFVGLQDMLEGTGWKLFERIHHDEDDEKIVMILMPERFEI